MRTAFVAALAALVLAPAAAHGETTRAALSWQTEGVDIDLHIWDDAGNHAWYASRYGIPDAYLTTDDTHGPGEEFSIDERVPSVRRFTFGVCYYADNADPSAPKPTQVTINMTDPSGLSRGYATTLTTPGASALVGSSPPGPGYTPADGWCDSPSGVAGPPQNLTGPRISGAALEGQVLTCDPGQWRDGPRSFQLDWLRDGQEIDSGDEHTIIAEDLDHQLVCRASASTGRGVAQADSDPVIPTTRLTLLNRFRPLLFFDTSERWRPLDVASFARERNGSSSRHRVCQATTQAGSDAECTAAYVPLVSIEQLGVFRPGYRLLIDHNGDGENTNADDESSPARGCRQDGRLDCDTGPLYGHTLQVAGYVVADYWWFFRYNDTIAPRNVPGLGDLSLDHEGDWEGIALGLPASTPTATRPDWVAMAGHVDDQPRKYLIGTLSCDANQDDGSCGTTGVHPNVYVSNGQHAAYPMRCSDDSTIGGILGGPLGAYVGMCKQEQINSDIPDGGHDGERPWGSNGVNSVVELPAPDGGTTWTDWPGAWGLPGNTNSPGNNPRYASGGALQPVLPVPRQAPAGSERTTSCEEWVGELTGAIVCDQQELQAAFAAGTLGQAGSVAANVPGHPVASAPGLVQVGGGALGRGESVTLTGAVTDGAAVVVQAFGTRGPTRTTFRATGMVAGGTIAVTNGADGAVVTLTSASGTQISPESRVTAPRPPTRVRVRRRGKRMVVVRLRASGTRVIVEQRHDPRGRALSRTVMKTRAGRAAARRMLLRPGARFVAVTTAGGQGTSVAVVRTIPRRR